MYSRGLCSLSPYLSLVSYLSKAAFLGQRRGQTGSGSTLPGWSYSAAGVLVVGVSDLGV